MSISFSSQWFQERSVAFYGVVFLVIWAGMLITGLWPFNFRPINGTISFSRF
ncbi:MAG TPA: hypothetical protein VMT12_10605 [Syntrophales bacterium]|nr:hypothetical protein [Syntrophales bacterium]